MATYGIRVRDAAGNITLDTSYRAGRIIGMLQSGTNPGSINVPGFSQGEGFAIAVPFQGSGVFCPTVTVSGTTLSWDWNGNGIGYRSDSLIVYGVR